ncbi:hypothetical protein [Sphingobacterium multivorum]|uniref:hypothetical protein n=1 Tax=Sphingobacterium multivorum TaxID=28454 RepID=UPI003519E0ED
MASLIDCGAQNWAIHEEIYNSSSESRLKFLGFCLLNRLEVIHEYNTAIIHVTKRISRSLKLSPAIPKDWSIMHFQLKEFDWLL